MPGNGAAGASYGDLLVTSLIVLGGVCIAAFVVVRLVGRFLATGRTRDAHLLDVVARLPLEPRRSLYVVEVAGKTLLLGTSEMGLSVLSELDAGAVRARVAERPSFGELVRTAWLRRRGPATREPPEPDSHAQGAPPSGAFDGQAQAAQPARVLDAQDQAAQRARLLAADTRPAPALHGQEQAARPRQVLDVSGEVAQAPKTLDAQGQAIRNARDPMRAGGQPAGEAAPDAGPRTDEVR